MTYSPNLAVLGAAILFFAFPNFGLAQDIQLSPAQEQLLNGLPAAQRQQALDAMRQLQSRQSENPQTTLNESLPTPDDQDLSSELVSLALNSKITAEPRARLVIDFTPKESITAEQTRELRNDPLIQNLAGSHLFVLDDSGVLSLPGLDEIPLLGLTEPDINRRLGAESYLALFDIDVRILAQTPIGVESLQPFGYNIFDRTENSFDSPSSGPVPSDYVLGPGDSVRVQLFGNVNGTYEYEVSRDGVLNFPELGPMTVAGVSFPEFRRDINARVRETLIGTQVSVAMGQLKTIRVFLLGDVKRPGSYVVSGLSTISGALYQGGGVSDVGSLRDIQLKRNGRIVSRLDVYDMIVRGDTSNDSRLQPGDVIFVPPVGKTVAVGGAVRRPAIYEVKRLTTASDIVALAGGLTPEAFSAGATLERIDSNGARVILAVNLASESADSIQLKAGDTLTIPEVLPEIDNAVELFGHVYRPKRYAWFSGMRLTDVIASTHELKPGVDPDYILIRRQINKSEPVQALSTSLSDALAAPGSESDISLKAGDKINVFSLAHGRQRIVEPLLREMTRQSTIDRPAKKVQISGNLRAPGIYPLEPGMRVSDLIRAGGSLAEDAYALEAELTRYSVVAGRGRDSTTMKVDLESIRSGNSDADILLQEHDYLIVSRIPEWNTIWTVALEGEVRFPGEYRVRRGDTLSDVVARAGGLTDAAFAEGAVFLRESLRDQEQDQIESLARRMEADLATLSLQSADTGGSETLSTGSVLLDQLRGTEAVGRLVIDLQKELQSAAGLVEVRDGDRLLVPTTTQVVTVIGETQQNTSHLFRADMSRDDYIELSGGLTRRADKKLIYVVRANGSVIAAGRSKWFGRKNVGDIRPGDTIVVPLDTDRMRPLTFWGNVTQILYQGAIAVAAVRTFNN